MGSRRHRRRIPASIGLPAPWRRYGAGTFVLAVLAAVVIYGRSARAPAANEDWARYHDRSFHVTRVVDGDTFDIDAPDGEKSVTRVRLWGVDTPELSHGRDPAMYFGPEAAAFADRILAGRSVHIVLSPRRTRGKYGRLLAYVYLERGGCMFNEMLLEEGYAYADLRFDHYYYDQFKAVEKRARRASAGLWANVTSEQMPVWRRRFEETDSEPGG